MVKTLKITTIAVAVLALALIIFIAAKGIASDKDIEKFLKTPVRPLIPTRTRLYSGRPKHLRFV
jgi:hypothetical protein